MQSSKKKKLEASGWKVGSASDFLELTQEEEAYIEIKLSLCKALKKTRVSKHLTQSDLAKKIKSSQSRVAKMEAGDASVSLDLIFKSLISIGASKKDIRNAIS